MAVNLSDYSKTTSSFEYFGGTTRKLVVKIFGGLVEGSRVMQAWRAKSAWMVNQPPPQGAGLLRSHESTSFWKCVLLADSPSSLNPPSCHTAGYSIIFVVELSYLATFSRRSPTPEKINKQTMLPQLIIVCNVHIFGTLN